MTVMHQGPLGPRFKEALAWTIELHDTQPRKGSKTPYAAHLLSVAGLVLEGGGDEDQAIAALLHDAPEDQGGQVVLDEIRKRFGERVARIVCAWRAGQCHGIVGKSGSNARRIGNGYKMV